MRQTAGALYHYPQFLVHQACIEQPTQLRLASLSRWNFLVEAGSIASLTALDDPATPTWLAEGIAVAVVAVEEGATASSSIADVEAGGGKPGTSSWAFKSSIS